MAAVCRKNRDQHSDGLGADPAGSDSAVRRLYWLSLKLI
jgi:hypothetical protein